MSRPNRDGRRKYSISRSIAIVLDKETSHARFTVGSPGVGHAMCSGRKKRQH
jgi:hypothetical protein